MLEVVKQADLFASGPALPAGFTYRTEFLTAAEEAALLEIFATLPFQEAKYKQFTAKRRIVTYGGRYDFSSNELLPAGPIPEFLYALRERIAEFSGIPVAQLTHAAIAEYRAGTQLGWHRDVPDFEKITGVSLAGTARMRLRPYPPKKGRRDLTLAIDLEPRSVYAIEGEARSAWQHAISPTKELRYSITMRTLAVRR
jgi:alkylated DNA repair dioxygenase AlkB